MGCSPDEGWYEAKFQEEQQRWEFQTKQEVNKILNAVENMTPEQIHRLKIALGF